MSRYAALDELTDLLTSVNLLALGADAAAQAPYLTEDLEAGESAVEAFCGRTFVPCAQAVHVVGGRNQSQIRLPGSPVFDVLAVQVGVDGGGTGFTINPSDLRLDRKAGRISLRSTLTISGVAPLMTMAYFPQGDNNVVVTYRTGWAAIGSNVGASALATAAFPDVATVSTDASYAYFDLPAATALWKKDGAATVAQRAPLVMWKTASGSSTATDDSTNWTLITPRRLRCLIASYTASAQYVFAYVPHAVGQAALQFAACETLRKKSIRDAAGSAGGVLSRTAGPFKEDYGDFQYAKQIAAFTERAQALLRPYVHAVVA